MTTDEYKSTLTQKRSSSSVSKEAEPLVMGCPGCGCWREREASLEEGYCLPPLTLHSERQKTGIITEKMINSVIKSQKQTRVARIGSVSVP